MGPCLSESGVPPPTTAWIHLVLILGLYPHSAGALLSAKQKGMDSARASTCGFSRKNAEACACTHTHARARTHIAHTHTHIQGGVKGGRREGMGDDVTFLLLHNNACLRLVPVFKYESNG